MPQEAIPAGQPTTISQTTAYALPVSRVWIVSSVPLQFSMQASTGFGSDVAASTTGMESAWPFCRCTASTAIVSVRKI